MIADTHRPHPRREDLSVGTVIVQQSPQTTTEIFWIAGAALTVFGTALAALAIKREWVRVLSAVLIIVVIVALRVAL